MLDGLRGLAILLVLWHHFFHPFATQHRGDMLLINLSRVGWTGVDLFFVLSGFLITGILLDSRNRTRYFSSFFARRVLRIFPMYYAVLGLAFFVFPLIPHPNFVAYVAESAPDQAWFWGYLTNWKLASRADWYPHVLPNIYWSLAVEEHFYLVWPFVVMLVRPARLLRVCVMLVIAGPLLRLGMVLADANPIATFVLTPARIDTIAVGAALAILVRRPEGIASLIRPARWVLAVGLALLGAVFIKEGSIIAVSDLVRTAGFSVIALVFGSLLVLVLNAREGSALYRLFSSHGLRVFGRYSYALYLLHGPIGAFMVDVLKPYEVPRIGGSMLPGMLLSSTAALIVSLVASWISWHVVEKHFLSLKRFFKTGEVKQPVAAVVVTLLAVTWGLGSPRGASAHDGLHALAWSPGSNQVVSTQPTLTVSFDQPVDPASATGALRVYGRWSGPMPGTVEFNPSRTELRFTPARGFQAGEWVTITLDRTARGENGATLDHGVSWNLWTRSEPGAVGSQSAEPIAVRLPDELQVQAYGAYAGDLNQDGWSDLAIPCEVSNDLRVFLGNSENSFTRHSILPMPAGSRPSPIEGCDLDLDGNLDLAIGNSGNDRVSLFYGNGDGSFASELTLAASQGVRGIAVLDCDTDGDDDVLAAGREGNSLVLLLNDGAGNLTPGKPFDGAIQESACAVADANGDGIMDLYVGGFAGRSVSLLLGDGFGGYRTSAIRGVPGNVWMLAAGDMNGDGFADVVSVNSLGNTLSVLLTDGAGGLSRPESYHPGVFPLAVDVGDLDGDGDLDVVSSNWGSGDWTVYENFGDGTLINPRTLLASSAGSCVVLHDRNRDGTLDITGIDEVDDLIFRFTTEPTTAPAPVTALPAPFPNPAHSESTIRFQLETAGAIQVRVFDASGRLVITLTEATLNAGAHRVIWDGRDARGVPSPAGVFYVRLHTPQGDFTQRIVRLP